MNRHQKIINFISTIRGSHSEMVNIFTKGSCLNFFLILRKQYPDAIAYYNVDHIITKIDSRFYDITGEIKNVDGYVPFIEVYPKKGLIRAFKQMYKAKYEF